MSDYPPDTARRRAKLDRKNARQRERYASDLAYRESQRVATRAWALADPHYQRDRKRRLMAKKYAMEDAAFTLHELACPYPSKGCRCRVVLGR